MEQSRYLLTHSSHHNRGSHVHSTGPEEAQGLQKFWPLHHLAFKFLNLTCHIMCSLHELLCILLIMSCNVLLVCHELCKLHIIIILY